MNPAFSKRNKAGVALLEVMISVSILAIGMGVALRSIGACARTQSRLEQCETGRRLAEQELAELKLRSSMPQEGESSGGFNPPFTAFSWTAKSYSPTDDFPFTLIHLKIWRDPGQGQQKRLIYAMRALT